MATDVDGVNFFNTRQAAVYIGISQSWLRQRRMTGTLGGQRPAPPFVRLGRSVRYSKLDLDQWLADQTHRSSVEDI
jgi:predicted DNA-binding transcriptional regulator AlpA